jgi:hypothetical protein
MCSIGTTVNCFLTHKAMGIRGSALGVGKEAKRSFFTQYTRKPEMSTILDLKVAGQKMGV